jgi:hypothetical protein
MLSVIEVMAVKADIVEVVAALDGEEAEAMVVAEEDVDGRMIDGNTKSHHARSLVIWDDQTTFSNE